LEWGWIEVECNFGDEAVAAAASQVGNGGVVALRGGGGSVALEIGFRRGRGRRGLRRIRDAY